MYQFRLILIISLSLLFFNSIKGQHFFGFKNFNISAGYGVGKIQYYFNNQPGITLGLNPDILQYSPAWYFAVRGRWHLVQKLDFTLAFEQTTVTEKHDDVPVPDWAGIDEHHLIQGFQHLTPGLSLTFQDNKFNINVGVRLGTASFIGNSFARENSNSLANGDFGFTSGFSIKILKRIYAEIYWIQGTTKYGVIQNDKTSFYKYHTYIFCLNYIFHEKK